MDLVVLGVALLLSMMTVGSVAGILMIHALWYNSRVKKLERQIDGVFNIMDKCLLNVDRETGQLWEYILSRR